MKSYVVLATIFAIYAVALIAAVAVAIPLEDEVATEEQQGLSRTRRDLSGVFDSIANGFGGLAEGARSVTDSIKNAFNSIFSTSNKNMVMDGFAKFQKGIKDAATELHGTVTNGFKQIGNSIKGAFGKGQGQGGQQGGGEKAATPEGEVPQGETT